ncbi:MAG: N-acyl-D-amino-acid deacylase family protein [Candidatus Limnocylindria bacterium]
MTYDLLIRGGKLIDGTGAPWIRADVAVQDGRIAAVGRVTGGAARVLDATDLYVTPGFVDMHAHSDLQLLADPAWELKLLQGVTCDVIGQDGLGLAPIDERTADHLREELRAWNGSPDVRWDWRSVADLLGRFDGHSGINVAALVPHGTVRLMAVGTERRAPSDRELDAMRGLVDDGLRDGAVGLSAGLTYAPGMFAGDDELVELCRVVREHNGYYAPHHRNYGSRALEAYRDSVAIGRAAGVPVHLTHAHLGYAVNRGRAPELLAMVDAARGEGVDVTLDTYPYLAGNTYLHALLPGWAVEGGSRATLARLGDASARRRIKDELEAGSEGAHGVRVDWSTIVVSSVAAPADRALVGRSIADSAAAAGIDPFELYCGALVRNELGAGCLIFSGNEENVRAIMRHPAHMAGSDGIVVGERPHPRAWGTFARYLAVYVRDLGLLRLEEMVRKMTSLPAQRLGLFDRGIVRPGATADLVCFDLDRVRDVATYEDPKRCAEGFVHVIVNGEQAVELSRHTGRLAGRALRRRPA